MYLDHWKLSQRPFDERIDPEWFFPSGAHQGAVVQMQSIIERRHSIALLAGPVGIGKSMVATTVAHQCDESCPTTTLHVNPTTASEVLHGIVDELHHSNAAGTCQASTSEVVELLKKQLGRRREAGQHVLAFLESMDSMPENEFGNLLHALGSLGDSPAITVFVIGSAEMIVKSRRLARQREELFPQCVIGSMAPSDTAQYVRHRMMRAGGDPNIFSEQAIERIHDLSGGIPRRVNRLCDFCLLLAYSKKSDPITENLVWLAQAEVRILAPSRTAVAAPTRRWRSLGKR